MHDERNEHNEHDEDVTFWKPVSVRIVPRNTERDPRYHYVESALGVLIEFEFKEHTHDTRVLTTNTDPFATSIATD